MDRTFDLRLAEPLDADQIGTIGAAVYAETYGHMWGDAQAYAVQLSTFGPAATNRFLARPDTALWVVEHGPQIVGFATLVLGSPDPIDGRTDGAEIPRIYLLAPAQGRGLAKAMLAEIESYALEMGANHLWLDAMLEAPWAWQAYKKWGFSEIGRSAFTMGIKPEFKPMLVLRRGCP